MQAEKELANLGLAVDRVGDVAVLDVDGEVDVASAPALREALIQLVSEEQYEIIVDLQDVGFLDSTGLGVLVGGLKRVRVHGGRFSLVCNQDRILKIFRITGLTKVFEIYDSVDAALQR